MSPITRRDMLKLTSAGSLAAIASAPSAIAENTRPPVPCWEVFEVSLPGPTSGNPFIDVQLSATFSLGHRTVNVDGFYDGAGTYKIRFMPDTVGSWSYMTSSNAPALDKRSGAFSCITALIGVHGPVSVRNYYHFAYEDGAPFFPFGTTSYAWIHQSEALQQETLATLRTAPFNKIRMCVFPKSYEYNHNEPPFYPFERTASGINDFTRPNPAFFTHLEQRIADLRALGIEADLILFHPYDRWGYATMPAEADDRYLRYILARLSAYRNIWWSLANEYDFMKAKTVQDFDRFFKIVEQYDPVPHLRSVHHGHVMYDYSKPWVTHASLQVYDFEKSTERHDAWRKPIVYDEIQYEGNLNSRWGNISGEEMTRRFWLGVIAGCYVTHGETFIDPDKLPDITDTPTIWWAHGGKLSGASPQRIAFLRKVLEATVPAGSGPDQHFPRPGLTETPNPYYLNATTVDASGKLHPIVLYYFDFHQPIWYDFPLPPGTYTVDMIDPWEMTIHSLPNKVTGKTKLKLSGKPYQAVRFTRVD